VIYFEILGPPHISRMAEASNLKLCMHIDGCIPKQNYAKVGRMGFRGRVA